jgi:hypothetical protein
MSTHPLGAIVDISSHYQGLKPARVVPGSQPWKNSRLVLLLAEHLLSHFGCRHSEFFDLAHNLLEVWQIWSAIGLPVADDAVLIDDQYRTYAGPPL